MKIPAFAKYISRRGGQRNVYVLFAMKRSGHHAVVNWICRQHGSISHQNNPFKQWEKKRIVANKTVDYGENPSDLLINLEDFDLTDWQKYKFDRFPVIRRADRVYMILLVREFRNWLASCIGRKSAARGRDRDVYENLQMTHKNEHGDLKPPRVALYRQHLDEAVDRKLFDDLIVVKYDEWFVSRDYRRQLAPALGLRFTDEGKEEVVRFGYGSSFDQQDYHGKASSMQVLHRWRKDVSNGELFDILGVYRDIENRSEQFFDIEQTKVIVDAPDRFLIAQKHPGFEALRSILPVLEMLNTRFPELELFYDATGLAGDEKVRMEEHCRLSGAVVTMVDQPGADDYKYFTGMLESLVEDEIVATGDLIDIIKIRTGLDLAQADVTSIPAQRNP